MSLISDIRKRFIRTSFKPAVIERVKGKIKPDDKMIAPVQEKGVEPHFENYGGNEALFKGVPIIAAAINKTVDFVVGTGFHVISNNASAAKLITDFMRQADFDNYLREVVRNLMLYGNTYSEIVRKGGKIDRLVNWNPGSIFVKRSENGKVRSYLQVFKNKVVTRFSPKKVIHYMNDVVGDEAYGTSLLNPICTVVRSKLLTEKHMSKNVVFRPIMHIKAGSDEFPASSGDITTLSQDLQVKDLDQLIVTNHLTEFKPVGYEKVVMNLDFESQYFTTQVAIGLQVPETLLGVKGSSNRSDVEEQLVAFQRRIKSIQFSIENKMEKELFRQVLDDNGISEDVWVEFEWGSDELQKKVDLQRIGQLLKSDIRLDDSIVVGLNKKVARVLDLKLTTEEIDGIEAPEVLPVPEKEVKPGSEDYWAGNRDVLKKKYLKHK